jgi:site-specific recombinase XerD
VCERAIHAANIGKRVSMHSLRHSYATHQFEHGNDIRLIQKALGHNNLRTTEIYTQVSIKEIAKMKSPFDYLPVDKLFEIDKKDVRLLKNDVHYYSS